MIHCVRTKWCLVTVGDYAVGKTSLIKVLTDNAFSPEEMTTIGMDPFQTILYHEDNPIELVILDTAGQERFKSLIPVYSRRSDAALVCFDMTNAESFRGIEEKVDSFLKVSESHKLVFVVATKMDLKDDFEVKEADVRRWAEVHDIPVFFTSAVSGQGVDVLKKGLARRLAEVSDDQSFQPMAGASLTERREVQRPCCA
jgi:small GTP-binding protein